MIKTANEEIHSAIRRARAVIAAGVRLKKPDLEKEGRADYARSVIENQILLYGQALTQAHRTHLIRVIHESNAIVLAPELQPEITPDDIVNPKPVYAITDPDDEYEEDEPEDDSL